MREGVYGRALLVNTVGLDRNRDRPSPGQSAILAQEDMFYKTIRDRNFRRLEVTVLVLVANQFYRTALSLDRVGKSQKVIDIYVVAVPILFVLPIHLSIKLSDPVDIVADWSKP